MNFSRTAIRVTSQQTSTYSKSTIETLKKGVNMFKVNNKDSRRTSYLTTFSSVSVVDFEQVIWLLGLGDSCCSIFLNEKYGFCSFGRRNLRVVFRNLQNVFVVQWF